MLVKANAKYVRMSPRKVRLVADVVRGLDLVDALNRLTVLHKKAETPVTKLVKSALANAEHNFNLVKENLFIKTITVNDGPTLFRWMPKAHGRATPIRKRTSMIDVVLAERVETATPAKPKKKAKIDTNEVTETIENEVVESVAMPAKGAEKTAKGEVKFDSKRQADKRDVQKVVKSVKKDKGAFKKMFQRKSGM